MLAVLSTKNTSACTGTLGNQVLGLEQNMNSQGKLLERERKKIEIGWGGGARSLPSILPLLQLACLLNQTAWWVLLLWVSTPPPPAPEPLFSASFLFVWLKTWSF